MPFRLADQMCNRRTTCCQFPQARGERRVSNTMKSVEDERAAAQSGRCPALNVILVTLIFTNCWLCIRHCPVSSPYIWPIPQQTHEVNITIMPIFFCKKLRLLGSLLSQAIHLLNGWAVIWTLTPEHLAYFLTPPWFQLANGSYIHQLTDIYRIPTMWQALFQVTG